jgi:hypothetical protein
VLAGLKACATSVTSASILVVQPFRVAMDGLARLGRHSLFIYWIHVELVYGYASTLWRGRLPLWGTALAYVAFCVLMFRALVLRDHLVGLWRSRRIDPTPQTAPV